MKEDAMDLEARHAPSVKAPATHDLVKREKSQASVETDQRRVGPRCEEERPRLDTAPALERRQQSLDDIAPAPEPLPIGNIDLVVASKKIDEPIFQGTHDGLWIG